MLLWHSRQLIDLWKFSVNVPLVPQHPMPTTAVNDTQDKTGFIWTRVWGRDTNLQDSTPFVTNID